MTLKAGIYNEELTMLMTVPNYSAVTNGENNKVTAQSLPNQNANLLRKRT